MSFESELELCLGTFPLGQFIYQAVSEFHCKKKKPTKTHNKASNNNQSDLPHPEGAVKITGKAFDVGREDLGPHISRGKILSIVLATKND